MYFCSINITFNVVFMYKIKFKHFLFPILPKLAPLMWLFSFCASCNLAVPFPVDCSVKFQPFSNNKHNDFHFLSAYWCILIHLDSVHFGNRLVINAWWHCFLWKIWRLSKSEIDYGVLFFRTCLMPPSHYLNQCWLISNVVQWHLSDGNFRGNAYDISYQDVYRNWLTHSKCQTFLPGVI